MESGNSSDISSSPAAPSLGTLMDVFEKFIEIFSVVPDFLLPLETVARSKL